MENSRRADKIRIFIGIAIQENLKGDLKKLENELSEARADVKWVKTENLHITLKFLGFTPADKIPDIFGALKPLLSCINPFLLNLKGVGAFPEGSSPRVVWVGVEDGKGDISNLQKKIEEALEKLNFSRENREYKPHLTIGRFKGRKNAASLERRITAKHASAFGEMAVRTIDIVRSDLGPEGPAYTVLHKIDLKNSSEAGRVAG